jgi:hypothetical protein
MSIEDELSKNQDNFSFLEVRREVESAEVDYII